jgi:hypothetical protein
MGGTGVDAGGETADAAFGTDAATFGAADALRAVHRATRKAQGAPMVTTTAAANETAVARRTICSRLRRSLTFAGVRPRYFAFQR